MPMSSFPATRLPVEVLDDIASLAIALGTISIKGATLVCPRWKLRYQKRLFKSVKLDPFRSDIPDLEKRTHLAPYIEVLRIAHRSGSSSPPDYNRDLAEPFTKFLLHAHKVKRMILLDPHMQWDNVSPNTIDAFRAVFKRSSFRSLEVTVRTPLPSWMLLYGTSVASDLTLHRIGSIMPPLESAELVSYQCSLTRLMLFSNSSVRHMAVFCLQHRYLAMDLLRNVAHAVLEYGEVDERGGPSITPYAEILVGFLAPQLEVLDLRVGSSIIPPSYISYSAIANLKALQRLSISLAGCSTGNADTLVSARDYMLSVFSGLPYPSPVKSFSLRVDDWRERDPEVDDYKSSYYNLLSCIYHAQLTCRKNWSVLTSSHILVNVDSNHFTESFSKKEAKYRKTDLRITSLLQVNIPKADRLGRCNSANGLMSQ